MVRKSYGKRRYKKRSPIRRRRIYRRRRSRNRACASLISKPLAGGLPRQLITKLRYSERVMIDPSTGIIGQYAFRANSIYDPNMTGGGHQPMGRDNFANYYSSYMVIGSKITAKFLNIENVYTVPVVYGILQRDSSTVTNVDPIAVMEQGHNRYRITNSKAVMTGGVGPTTVVSKWSAKKWYGFRDWRDNTYGYGAAMGSNATDQVYFICYYGDTTSQQDLNSANVLVTIEYCVYYYDPVELLQS